MSIIPGRHSERQGADPILLALKDLYCWQEKGNPGRILKYLLDMTVRAHGVEQNTWTGVDYVQIVRPMGNITRRVAPYLAGILIVALAIMFAMSCKAASVAFRTDSSISTLNVEVARTQAQRAKGLSGRPSLPANSGMLFDFGTDTNAKFYMANTTIPLSIAFIDSSGKVVEVTNMKPLDPTNVGPGAKYRWAVEANKDWFQEHGIRVGSTAVIDL